LFSAPSRTLLLQQTPANLQGRVLGAWQAANSLGQLLPALQVRLFHCRELMGPAAGDQPVVFGRFEAAAPNERWVGDALHGPRVGGEGAVDLELSGTTRAARLAR
jgi:hypothetical protein